MITARNYAAQAENFLMKLAKTNEGRFETSSRNARLISNTIKISQHFAIPDDGVIFNDKLKGLDLDYIRLPFKNITIEWFVKNPLGDGKHLCPKRILVASEDEEHGAIHCVGVWQSNEIYKGAWGFNPYKISFRMDNTRPFNQFFQGDIIPLKFEDGREIMIAPSFTQDQFMNGVKSGTISIKECLDALQDSTQEVMSLFEFLEALSCKNVTTEPLNRIDQAKAARRAKQSKLPLYETHILTVDVNHGSIKTDGNGINDRASVRQHLRRGHIRRHPTAGNIWVQSCLVGSAENGIIHKQYHITKGTK